MGINSYWPKAEDLFPFALLWSRQLQLTTASYIKPIMSDWRLLVTDMKSCRVATLIRLPSLATTEDGISKHFLGSCLPVCAHTVLNIESSVWAVEIQGCVCVCTSAARRARRNETEAMTLVNSKHTTESSLEKLFPLLTVLLHWQGFNSSHIWHPATG